MPHREIIEDICENCKSYCTLKEILLHSGMEDRVLEQLKCIEKFKFEKSKENRNDIGWGEAHILWVKEGYAEEFSKIYKEGMTHKEIWRSLFNHEE